MAKQSNIQGAVDKLRTENKKQFVELNDNQEKTAVATEKTARLINDMLEAMALERQRNQDKEEKGSKKGGMAGGSGSSSGSKKPKGDSGLDLPFGLLAIPALAGLTAGMLDKYRKMLSGANKEVNPKGTTAKNTAKQTKTFKENLKGIGDKFKGINTRLQDVRIKSLSKLETGIKSFKTEVGKLGNRFTNFSTSLQNIKPPKIIPDSNLKPPKFDVDPKDASRLSQTVDRFRKLVQINSLSNLLDSVSEKMPKKEFFNDIKTRISTKIDGMRSSITPLVNRFEELRSNIATKAAEKFEGAKTKISSGVDKLKDSKFVQSLKNINAESKPIKMVLDPIKSTIESIKGKWDGIGKQLGKVLSKSAAVGKALAWPLQAIIGIVTGYQGIKENIKQHEDLINNEPEKYFAGTMGAIEGALNGIIMAPLDMLKSASSWIFDKVFNFDRNPDGTIKAGQGLPSWAMKQMEAFSFQEMTSGLFDGVTRSVLHISNYISSRLADPSKLKEDLVNLPNRSKDIAEGLWGSMTTAVERMFDSLTAAIDEKFKNVTNMFDGLGDVAGNIKTSMKNFFIGLLPDPNSFFGSFIPNSVYEWGGVPVPDRSNVDRRGREVDSLPPLDPVLQEQIDQDNQMTDYAITGLEFNDSKKLKFDKTQEFFKNNPQALANFIAANTDSETGELRQSNLEQALRSRTMKAEDKQFLRQKKAEIDRLIKEGGTEEEIQLIRASIIGVMRRGFSDLQKGYVNPFYQSGISSNSGSLVVNAGDKGKQLLSQQAMNASLNGASNTSIVVAPSTSVVNNNSSQGIIMNQNMPVVDPLDQAYGV